MQRIIFGGILRSEKGPVYKMPSNKGWALRQCSRWNYQSLLRKMQWKKQCMEEVKGVKDAVKKLLDEAASKRKAAAETLNSKRNFGFTVRSSSSQEERGFQDLNHPPEIPQFRRALACCQVPSWANGWATMCFGHFCGHCGGRKIRSFVINSSCDWCDLECNIFFV